nr:hypothetical protein Iba_chr06bCG16510 [Ipomoea batatas]
MSPSIAHAVDTKFVRFPSNGRSEQLCERLHYSRNSFPQLPAPLWQSKWHRESKFPRTHTMTHLGTGYFQVENGKVLPEDKAKHLQHHKSAEHRPFLLPFREAFAQGVADTEEKFTKVNVF